MEELVIDCPQVIGESAMKKFDSSEGSEEQLRWEDIFHIARPMSTKPTETFSALQWPYVKQSLLCVGETKMEANDYVTALLAIIHTLITFRYGTNGYINSYLRHLVHIDCHGQHHYRVLVSKRPGVSLINGKSVLWDANFRSFCKFDIDNSLPGINIIKYLALDS